MTLKNVKSIKTAITAFLRETFTLQQYTPLSVESWSLENDSVIWELRFGQSQASFFGELSRLEHKYQVSESMFPKIHQTIKDAFINAGMIIKNFNFHNDLVTVETNNIIYLFKHKKDAKVFKVGDLELFPNENQDANTLQKEFDGLIVAARLMGYTVEIGIKESHEKKPNIYPSIAFKHPVKQQITYQSAFSGSNSTPIWERVIIGDERNLYYDDKVKSYYGSNLEGKYALLDKIAESL